MLHVELPVVPALKPTVHDFQSSYYFQIDGKIQSPNTNRGSSCRNPRTIITASAHSTVLVQYYANTEYL